MQRSAAWNLGIGTLALAVGVGLFVLTGASCGTAPTAFIVNGPGQLGNDPPTLQIVEPIDNVTRSQGSPLLIRWVDTDSDDNAQISFELVSTLNNARVPLVTGLAENDLSGPDTVTVGTTLVPQGSYNLLGTIDDATNPPVQTFATLGGTEAGNRVIVRITGEGEGQQSVPPIIAVTAPPFGLSVTQDDVVRVTVVPSELGIDPNRPFDPDSDIRMTLLLDLDQDPNNDDPANPDPTKIIVLEERLVQEAAFEEEVFNITIDLDIIPARSGGLPYYIRITANDLENPAVHRYAVGTINVTQLASGTVDLSQVGSITSGARWYGFNPGARTGSSIASVSDFDQDGGADFVIVAQKGNPRNQGPIGEAYLVYGQIGESTTQPGTPDPTQPGVRFGGAIPVNSVAQTVSGAVFEGPPARFGDVAGTRFRTDGITDVSFIRSVDGDGRPELLFGLQHVNGALELTDFDPEDTDIEVQQTVAIEVEVTQGSFTVLKDEVLESRGSYRDTVDTTISAVTPSTALGTESDLSWQFDPEGDRRWTLLKFENLLSVIPDTVFNIEAASVQGELQLRLFDTGVDGSLHRVITDFGQFTTYDSYANGDPVAGVDYEADALETVSAGASDFVTISIDEYVTELIDGVLDGENDELRFIIVPPSGDGDPDAEAADRAAVRSSEYSILRDRPKLTITYNRLQPEGALGCYPDRIVNNFTDAADGLFDSSFYAGGMAVFVNSTNRDSNPRIDPTPIRLDTTSVALELAGQRGDALPPSRADDYETVGRIAGARFVAGWYDSIDHAGDGQGPRDGLFGQTVASIPDVNSDGLDEIVISAPRNSLYMAELRASYPGGTQLGSTFFQGNIVVLPGTDYNDTFWRDINSEDEGNSVVPRFGRVGSCTATPAVARGGLVPVDSFQVFPEAATDMLGGARSAGDYNQDGIGDIVCGAPENDRGAARDSGAAYVLYGRPIVGNFFLADADDPIFRAPMLRIRGVNTGDQIGWKQSSGLDVNGDRIDDVFISSPWTDFGGITRNVCADDFNGDGLVNDDDLQLADFNSCLFTIGDAVFSDDSCKAFDYDNDGDIDEEDKCVFCCLSPSCEPDPDCVHGREEPCCEDMVDNGFVGVVFGGVFTDGDRTIDQLASSDLAGARFYGAAAQHLAGWDVASAGDFNQDGFGDLLIAVPGETRFDTAGRLRLGVVYLVFGGTHLTNTTWNLSAVGSDDLPGIVFLSPYVRGRPNEAAPITVAGIGDINNDGFDDIAIGNPKADFIDLSFPQGPDAPGSDAEVGRRRDAGDAYVIYGNNFGTNRGN